MSVYDDLLKLTDIAEDYNNIIGDYTYAQPCFVADNHFYFSIDYMINYSCVFKDTNNNLYGLDSFSDELEEKISNLYDMANEYLEKAEKITYYNKFPC